MRCALGAAWWLGALGVVSTGCSKGGYTVVVRFEPVSLASSVEDVEVSLGAACAMQGRAGESPVGAVQTVEVRRGAGSAPLGDVAPGAYGLYGRGRAAACGVVAAGCTDVTLEAGGEGELVVTLTAVSGPGCPIGTTCMTGRCVGPDAGMDASRPDAGDAGRPDAASDAAVDSGASCACAPCETCNASGACVPALDGVACAGGVCHASACCTGCWDGTSCQTGDTDLVCGGAGEACSACDVTACPPTTCRAGACAPLGVTVIASRTRHTCAVATDGSLWCWGKNDREALGTGDGVNHLSPARVGTDTDWRSIALGEDCGCAIKASGSLWCWGDNRDGQLGVGDTVVRATPTRVGADSDWVAVSFGERHACGVKTGGSLWCWGSDGAGQLGVASAVAQTMPVMVPGIGWARVSCRANHSCATRTDGSLWCWGSNTRGQCGQGMSGGSFDAPTRVGPDNDWSEVAAGGQAGLTDRSFTCAVRVGGSLWCWGDNGVGQLATGTAGGQLSVPTRAGTDVGWTVLTAGTEHACALRTTGTLFCWGSGSEGRLGLGDTTGRQMPTMVGAATTWTQVSAGDRYTCARQSDSSAWCWGDGGDGVLGIGDTPRLLTPTRVCL